MEYSYNYNENTWYGTQSQATETVYNESQPARPQSANQVALYTQICTEKGETPKATASLNFAQMSALIDEVKKLNLASPAQRELIQTKLQDIRNMGVTLNVTDEQIATLTGGKEGTASKFIDSLMKIEEQYSDRKRITESQVQTLVSWFLCPDIPFESYGVTLTKTLDEYVTLADGSKKQLWTYLSPMEFAQQIQANFNYKSAREFIQQHRAEYHEWKKSRISTGQLNRIMALQNRMSDISNPKFTELAVDLEGNIIEVEKYVTDRGRNWNPDGYVPLSQMQLMMFDRKQAHRHMVQLEAELKNRELTRFSKDEGADAFFEALRNDPTQDQLQERQIEALRDSIYALMSALGQREHDFEHDEPRLIVERWAYRHKDTQVNDLISYLEEMMVYAVDNNFITQEGLEQLVSNSTIAIKIATAAW